MQIRIIKPGLLSTIQDLGRHHYLSQAVPVSGAMDLLSARLANIAVGNPENAAVIEFTYSGAEFIAETDLLIAFAGDGAVLKTNYRVLPSDRPLFIPAGMIISLANNSGSRTYLAVAGGWDVPEVLGSRSTYVTAGFGGLNGRALQSGDMLNSIEPMSDLTQKIIDRLKDPNVNYFKWSLARNSFLPANKKNIRVVPGPEFGWFTGLSLVEFLSAPFTLNMRSNRMGYHLDGPLISRVIKQELLSTAVAPGTIQVTGSGNLVLLMADCQTTGGYPRIAQVATVDLPLCGQLKAGDALYFKEISRQDAEILYLEQEEELRMLNTVVRNKF